MSTDFIPATDAGLLAYSANFSSLMTADAVAYGCTSAMAVTLASLQSGYASALAAATDPATRGGSKCYAKNIARRDLVAYIRQLARTVQGTATVTDQQKYDLGVTVRKTTPSPQPAPSQSPTMVVLSTRLNTVRAELRTTSGPGVSRRGRPPGVAGAAVFSYIGAEAPSDPSAWSFEGNTTKTEVLISFDPGIAPGTKVWLCSFWFNNKMASGAASVPISTNVQGGGAGVGFTAEQLNEAA